MFIKLTNVAKEFKDTPLVLNSRYLVSIFETKDEQGEPVTVVYNALQTAWNVKETPSEIFEMIGESK